MTPPTLATTAETDVPDTKTADNARVLQHEYDGIREYDNPLPGWWRAIFWATIVFAAGYWVWFHVTGWGGSPDAKYRAALGEYADRKGQREQAELRDISEDTFSRYANEPKTIARGQEIFAARCASCHAAEGQGLIGPNLTDRYQLHGTTRMDIFKTVRGGVPGTAMLAWGEQMPSADVATVTTFVITLRGQNKPGKEPQGQPVEPFK
jgi:cytochrome c oxidase cbb3-type subunit III